MSDKIWNGRQMEYLRDPLSLPSIIQLQSNIELTPPGAAHDAYVAALKAGFTASYLLVPFVGTLTAQPKGLLIPDRKAPATGTVFVQGITPLKPYPSSAVGSMLGYSPKVIVGVGDDILYG